MSERRKRPAIASGIALAICEVISKERLEYSEPFSATETWEGFLNIMDTATFNTSAFSTKFPSIDVQIHKKQVRWLYNLRIDRERSDYSINPQFLEKQFDKRSSLLPLEGGR